VLGRQYYWFIRFPLDIERMRRAAAVLTGRHDFSCFCATGCDIKDRTRTLSDIAIDERGCGLLEITVESSGFLRHMVRNIVGTLVDVGRGKLNPDDIPDIIASRDRKKAGAAAPACGLFLKEVKY
jgi:tRNA pseudouridine38-40 synthase